MSLDTLLRRIDAYLRAARKRLPRVGRLPHVIVRPEWSKDGDVAPDHREWRAFERGNLAARDWDGYAQQNDEYRVLAQALRLPPKVYGFDADAEHEAGVREHEALQWEMTEDYDTQERKSL